MPQAIHISPIDNVVVALHPIAKGTLVEVDGLAVTALEDTPQGHKMAVKPIKNGENVIKYGFPIGHATADAAPGTWMHTHNVQMCIRDSLAGVDDGDKAVGVVLPQKVAQLQSLTAGKHGHQHAELVVGCLLYTSRTSCTAAGWRQAFPARRWWS